MLSEIEDRIDKGAINKACEFVQLTLPEKFKQDVHTYWVKELIDNAFEGLKKLDVPKNSKEVKISSAFTLTADQRKGIHKKIKETLKRDMDVKEEIDPAVIAGLVISVGSLVLDGSLRNKIMEQSRKQTT